MSNSKLYFPSLNGIRAIAALMVLVSHIDQHTKDFGLHSLGLSGGIGWKGVVLFFTLSGFLITYLLILEKEKFNTIEFVQFYIRRILRIWPIYYLIILLTIVLFFVLPMLLKPSTSFWQSITLFSTLLGNVEYIFGAGIVTLTPLWSVAVEEQFYLMWPWVMNSSKKYLQVVLIFLVIFFLIKLGLRHFDNSKLYALMYITSFGCMALGAVAACLSIQQSKILKVLDNTFVQLFFLALFVLSSFTDYIKFPTFIQREAYALIDAIVLLNLATSKRSLIHLENSIFDFLGKISYGIYVYHMLIITVVSYFLSKYIQHLELLPLVKYVLIYVLIIGGTLILSHYSFKYYETWFLKLKLKFTKIHNAASKN